MRSGCTGAEARARGSVRFSRYTRHTCHTRYIRFSRYNRYTSGRRDSPLAAPRFSVTPVGGGAASIARAGHKKIAAGLSRHVAATRLPRRERLLRLHQFAVGSVGALTRDAVGAKTGGLPARLGVRGSECLRVGEHCHPQRLLPRHHRFGRFPLPKHGERRQAPREQVARVRGAKRREGPIALNRERRPALLPPLRRV